MNVIDFNIQQPEQLNGFIADLIDNFRDGKSDRKANRADRRDGRNERRVGKALLKHDTRSQKRDLRNDRRINNKNIRFAKWEARGGKTGFGAFLSDIFNVGNNSSYTPPTYQPIYQPTEKTNNMGGLIMGAIVVSGVAGAIYFGNKKDKPKTNK